MPTIEIEYEDFVQLLGLELERNVEKIDEVLSFVKGEVKKFDEKEGVLTIEIKDTNRPDLWNVEGLARALRGFLGLEKGMKPYAVETPASRYTWTRVYAKFVPTSRALLCVT